MDSLSSAQPLRGRVAWRKVRTNALALCACANCVAADPSRAKAKAFQRSEVKRVIKRAKFLPEGTPAGLTTSDGRTRPKWVTP